MSNNDLETIQTHAGGLLNNSHFNIWYFQATEFRYQKAALSPANSTSMAFIFPWICSTSNANDWIRRYTIFQPALPTLIQGCLDEMEGEHNRSLAWKQRGTVFYNIFLIEREILVNILISVALDLVPVFFIPSYLEPYHRTHTTQSAV